jgi:iron complex outermembrane recepter protein
MVGSRRCALFYAFTVVAVTLGAAVAAAEQAASASAGSTGQQAAPAVANTPQELVLEEVLVQARRVDESQQSVPLSVSTVSEQRLQEAAVTSTSEIQRLLPSLQVRLGPSGQQDWLIRGSLASVNVDPSVVTYFDDVPINSRLIVYNLFDVSSVQQLKGPQGTLFGRNTTGGAVLFFSNRPSVTGVGGYLSARYGNLDERRLEGAVNVPLSDELAVRVAGQLERRDGTLHSVTAPGLDFDNRHNEAIRASVRWAPSDAVENLTRFTVYRVNEHRFPNRIVSLVGPCTGPVTPAPACLFQPPFNALVGTGNIRAFFTQQQGLGQDQTVANDPTTDKVNRDEVINSFTWSGDALSVRNITYYAKTQVDFSRDFDGTPVRVFDLTTTDDTKTLYSEMHLFGAALQARLNWLVGAGYGDDQTEVFQNQSIFAVPVSLAFPQNLFSDNDFKATAVFGQATYDLSGLLPGVSVTGGYRYTWDDRTARVRAFSGQPTQVCALQTLPVPAGGPVAFPDTNLAACTRTLAAKFNDSNFNLTLDWKPIDRLMLYTAFRQGYKTGSFNLLQINPAFSQYEPEVVKDVEFGLKADWKLGSAPIRTNLAAFRSKYTNIQQQFVLRNPATGGLETLVLNKDTVTGLPSKATFQGFELEATVAPASWLQVSGFYSRVLAEYDQFIVPTTRANLAGADVGMVTPQTYGVTTQARVPLSQGIRSLDLTASYYASKDALSNVTTLIFQKGRRSLDASVGLRELFSSSADLVAYGKNLSDEEVCTDNPAVAGAITLQNCIDGRTYGIELTYRFGIDQR